MSDKQYCFDDEAHSNNPMDYQYCKYFAEHCPYKNNDDEMCIICIGDTMKQLQSLLKTLKRHNRGK